MDPILNRTFTRQQLPPRLCNLDRLIHAMESRGLNGIVACTPWNMYYLTGFNGIAHKADEPRPYACILSRQNPENPILKKQKAGRSFGEMLRSERCKSM